MAATMRVTCAQCTAEFDKRSSDVRLSKSGRHFCNRSCAASYNNVHRPRRPSAERPMCMGCHERRSLPRRRYCSNECYELRCKKYGSSDQERRYAAGRAAQIDWVQVQAYYDQGFHIRDCYSQFDIDYRIWKYAQDRGWVSPRTPNESKRIAGRKRRTLRDEQIFCTDSRVSRGMAKRRILLDELIPYVCTECSALPFWMGQPMTLVLDHINGINNDHRLENLRFLCPNCNSQSSTFAGRNKRPEIGAV